MIPPQYFDIIGVVTFTILLILGISLKKKEKTASIIIIAISILGLITDIYSVITNFIIGH